MDETQTQETQETSPRLKTLKNGAIYDLDKGRIVANPGGGKSAITPARSRELREIRAAKAERLMRERITAATAKVSDLPISGAPQAVAEAAGILWDEIVLNEDAYHRDRLEAFLKLTERAGMTSERKRSDAENPSREAVGELVGVVRELRQAILDTAGPPAEVIEGKVTDTRKDLPYESGLRSERDISEPNNSDDE